MSRSYRQFLLKMRPGDRLGGLGWFGDEFHGQIVLQAFQRRLNSCRDQMLSEHSFCQRNATRNQVEPLELIVASGDRLVYTCWPPHVQSNKALPDVGDESGEYES